MFYTLISFLIKKIKFKLLLLIFSSSFVFGSRPSFGLCADSLCDLITSGIVFKDIDYFSDESDQYLQYKINLNHSSNRFIEDYLNIILESDNKNILNLLAQSSEPNSSVNQKRSINIEADIQYQEEDKFYAEGNVITYIGDIELKADKIIFDQKENTYSAIGNILFKKGNQYFQAAKIVYNFSDNKGFIEDIYGVINLDTFSKDLDLSSVSEEEIEELQKVSNQYNNEVFRPSSLGITNYTSFINLEFKIENIQQWRFKSKKLYFTSNSLDSDQVIFTNDLYNKPQLVLQSNKFKGDLESNKLKFTSSNSFLIFDDKLKIPIGRKTINTRDYDDNWGIGYEKTDKDGLFIFRNYAPINIGKYLKLDLTPYFLIQRAIEGKTNSFTAVNSSITSDKVSSEIETLDYFALDSNLYGDVFNWKFNLRTTSNSLSSDRIARGSRINLEFKKSYDLLNNYDDLSKDMSISKDIDKHNKRKIDFTLFGAYREKIPTNFSGWKELYSAYGSQAIYTDFITTEKNIKRNLLFAFDIGQYQGEKRNSKDLIDLSRYTFSSSLKYSFPIWNFNSGLNEFNQSYVFTPRIIDQDLLFITEISSTFFSYSDSSTQEVVNISLGPEITFGELRKPFLDFTQASIKYGYVFKSGESPFKFDNIENSARISFDLKQQVYGALLFGFKSNINLNSESTNYGKFLNTIYSLDIKRRAYSIGAFYDSHEESIGINFEIYNFGSENISPKF